MLSHAVDFERSVIIMFHGLYVTDQVGFVRAWILVRLARVIVYNDRQWGDPLFSGR